MSKPVRSWPLPPVWRIVAAFFVAPLAASVLLAIVAPLYMGLELPERIIKTSINYLLFGAYPSALVIGVPALFLLKNRLRPTVLNCSACGAVVAALPWLLLGLAFDLFPAADEATDGGHVTVLHQQTTLWGWIYSGETTAQMAAIGLFGGFVFWLVAAAGVKPPRPDVTPL